MATTHQSDPDRRVWGQGVNGRQSCLHRDSGKSPRPLARPSWLWAGSRQRVGRIWAGSRQGLGNHWAAFGLQAGWDGCLLPSGRPEPAQYRMKQEKLRHFAVRISKALISAWIGSTLTHNEST